jgi:tRNA A37 N6-isopentenylltransferase MiaA
MSVVVYGPMACGKTRHAGAIARHFGLKRVVDDWDHKLHRITPGALHLTTTRPIACGSARVIGYEELPAHVRSNAKSADDAGLRKMRPAAIRRFC